MHVLACSAARASCRRVFQTTIAPLVLTLYISSVHIQIHYVGECLFISPAKHSFRGVYCFQSVRNSLILKFRKSVIPSFRPHFKGFMPPPFKECGRAFSVAHVRSSVRASVLASFCASFRPSFKWVLCERNSSYNFIPILLKLYRCFCQGLKMCMTFGYNPQINFCHFFHSLNLVIFGLNYY